jgi:peptidoglycan/xylan/chitin deacetylase (PgdA/CDA1 family)
MLIERPLGILRRLFPDALWRMDKREKCVYLTFDDGPVPETTPQVLDILDRYGVKATFFCVGDNVGKYPGVFRQIVERGHRVGNHSFNHVRAFSMPEQEYLANIQKARELIHSDLVRPPHGQLTPRVYRALKKDYRIVMWDLITRDYNRSLTPEAIVNIVRKYVRNGSIIVFHDSEKSQRNVLGALSPSIDYLLQQGFRFDTI